MTVEGARLNLNNLGTGAARRDRKGVESQGMSYRISSWIKMSFYRNRRYSRFIIFFFSQKKSFCEKLRDNLRRQLYFLEAIKL